MEESQPALEPREKKRIRGKSAPAHDTATSAADPRHVQQVDKDDHGVMNEAPRDDDDNEMRPALEEADSSTDLEMSGSVMPKPYAKNVRTNGRCGVAKK